MIKPTLVLTALLTTTLTFANPIENLKVVSEDTQAQKIKENHHLDYGAIRDFLEGQISDLDLQAPDVAASDTMDIDFKGMRDFLNRRLNQK